MATKKELLAQADAAGVEVSKSWKKAKIEKALADAGVGSDAGVEATDGDGIPGVPTEPEKAGISGEALARLEEDADRIAAAGGGDVPKDVGIPTEPDRGGVTESDVLVAQGKPPKTETAKAEKPKRPSITGNPYAPTEPDRGGVNKLEKELSGAE